MSTGDSSREASANQFELVLDAPVTISLRLAAMEFVEGDTHVSDRASGGLQDASRRQLTFRAGRLCAARALTVAGAPTVDVGCDENGAPVWPPGWTGSISHSALIAVAAVAPAPAPSQRLLGIDVERILTPHEAEDVRRVCLTAREQGRVEVDTFRDSLTTLIFSAKESYYKAVHSRVRRYVDFNEVEVEVGVLRQNIREAFLVSPVDPGGDLPPLSGWAFVREGHVWTIVDNSQ